MHFKKWRRLPLHIKCSPKSWLVPKQFTFTKNLTTKFEIEILLLHSFQCLPDIPTMLHFLVYLPIYINIFRDRNYAFFLLCLGPNIRILAKCLNEWISEFKHVFPRASIRRHPEIHHDGEGKKCYLWLAPSSHL